MKLFPRILFLTLCLAVLPVFSAPVLAGDSTDLSPDVKQAVNIIRDTYKDRVEVSTKAKSLLKFGRNAGTCTIPLSPPIIVPKNADLRVRAISSGTTTGVEASVNGFLAEIRN